MRLPATLCAASHLVEVANVNSASLYQWCFWKSCIGSQAVRLRNSSVTGPVPMWISFGWFQGKNRQIPTSIHLRVYESDGRKIPFSFMSMRVFINDDGNSYRASLEDSLEQLAKSFEHNAHLSRPQLGL